MFCPQCGTETLEQLKFCKKCGINLRRVQGVMGKGGAGYLADQAGVDWEREARDERRQRRKRSPEEKRLNEIKGGVITSSVGLGVTIFLSFLFDAIANIVDPEVQGILRAIPFVGVLPFLIGLGVIFNGVFIGKRLVELKRREEERERPMPLFSAPNTTPVAHLVEGAQSPIADFSIAEPTTKTLREPAPVPATRDTN
ncbi:MAG: zinc ribbon domain-containing protein [Blastocatellia bacterium]